MDEEGADRVGAFVRLFEVEPDLLWRAPVERREGLTRQVSVPMLTLAAGPWIPDFDAPAPWALVVIDGLLIRETEAFERCSAELLGRGDVLSPMIEEVASSTPRDVAWKSPTGTRLAVLTRDSEQALARIPGVAEELLARTVRRSRDLALQAAIARVRPLPSRLLLLFWHLADRWGWPRARRQCRGRTLQ